MTLGITLLVNLTKEVKNGLDLEWKPRQVITDHYMIELKSIHSLSHYKATRIGALS